MSYFSQLALDAVAGTSPWAAPTLDGPLRPLPSRCECLVIGAGVTGLAAALALAEDGRDVVVLERSFGSGATSRSGGIIIGETLAGPSPDFDGCEFDLRDWVERSGTTCRLSWTGCLELVRDDATTRPTLWRDGGGLGVARLVEGGVLDPAALLTDLATAATRRGAIVVDHTNVREFARRDSHLRFACDSGTLVADRAIIAVDATARGIPFDPWPQRLFTVALETEVISDELANAVGWNDRLPFYTNDLPLLWGRSGPGGGMIAGRELVEGHLSGPSLNDAILAAQTRLTARVRGLHAELATIGIARVWAGPIARDATMLPGVLQDPLLPGVWWAGGYGGHGLAQAFRQGFKMARRLVSETL